jgi:hypothetical protein
MKRVKISLQPGSNGKKFYLFPSSEALYLWTCAIERNEVIQIPGIEEFVLEPNGFIEAELRGFEYVHEGNEKYRRLDLIRMGKAQQTKNASGVLVTIHVGWVSGGLLPMKNYSDNEIEARVISETESKLDLATLFNDELAVKVDEIIELDDSDVEDDNQ